MPKAKKTEVDAEDVVDRQMKAYQKLDIEGFVACYADDVIVEDLEDGSIYANGAAELKTKYGKLFKSNPGQKLELLNRIRFGDYIVDHEWISGRAAREDFEAVAIYHVKDEKIRKVWFLPRT